MNTINRAIGVASLAGLVFLLSGCAKPEPPKGTTAAPPQAVAKQPQAAQEPVSTPSPPGGPVGAGATEPEAEEYAVYDAAITGLGESPEPLLILDTTATSSLDSNTLDHIRRNGAQPTQDMIRDYNAKNKKSQRLGPRFRINRQCTVISDEEVGKKVDEMGEMRMCGGSLRHCICGPLRVRLSRPGFNSQGDQAIVRLHSIRGMGGEHSYVVLAKTREGWRADFRITEAEPDGCPWW